MHKDVMYHILHSYLPPNQTSGNYDIIDMMIIYIPIPVNTPPLIILSAPLTHILFYAHRWGYYDGVQASMPATAVCITQTFPVAEYVGPAAASLRGATGFEIMNGGNIFGAFDNGFVNVRSCCLPALHKPYFNP